MSDKVRKLSFLNVVLISAIIALGCVAVVIIVRIYGSDTPASTPPATRAPAPSVTTESPAESKAAAIRHLVDNPPQVLLTAREEVEEHLVADYPGRVLWQRRVGKLEGWPIAVAGDTVYVTTSAGMLYAIDGQGEISWSKSLDEYLVHRPVLDGSGNVFCCTRSKVWSFDPAGNLNWEFGVPGSILSRPVIDFKGNLIIKAENRKDKTAFIMAVNRQGEQRWRYDAEYELTTNHMAAGIHGRIFDLGKGGTFLSITPAGTRGWGLGLSDHAMGPAVDRRGMIHVAANPYDDREATFVLLCMEPYMGEVWSVELPNRAKRGPFVNDAGNVYVMCQPPQGNHMYPPPILAFDKAGTQLWETGLSYAQTLVCSSKDGDPLGVNTTEGAFFLDSSGKILFSLGDDEGHPHPIAIQGNTAYCYADEVLTALDLSPRD